MLASRNVPLKIKSTIPKPIPTRTIFSNSIAIVSGVCQPNQPNKVLTISAIKSPLAYKHNSKDQSNNAKHTKK